MTVTSTRESLTAARIRACGVIPVVVLHSADQATPLGNALIDAGLPVAEITLRSDAALEAISLLRVSHPDALVGAGTVRTT